MNDIFVINEKLKPNHRNLHISLKVSHNHCYEKTNVTEKKVLYIVFLFIYYYLDLSITKIITEILKK